jgi:hypothetical protein
VAYTSESSTTRARTDIQLWSEAVLAAECQAETSHGVGAERVCRLTGGVTIRERWLEREEGRGFVYEEVGIPLVAIAGASTHTAIRRWS